MAEEAKIRVRLEVDEADRNMQRVNRQFERARDSASAFASGISGTLTRVASLAGLAAGGLELASPGFLNYATQSLTSLASQGARQLLGGENTASLDANIARFNAQQRAADQVKQIVGAGGTFTDAQIRQLLRDFTAINEPGQRNIQQVDRLSRQQVADDYREKFNQAVEKFSRAVDKFFSGGG